MSDAHINHNITIHNLLLFLLFPQKYVSTMQLRCRQPLSFSVSSALRRSLEFWGLSRRGSGVGVGWGMAVFHGFSRLGKNMGKHTWHIFSRERRREVFGVNHQRFFLLNVWELTSWNFHSCELGDVTRKRIWVKWIFEWFQQEFWTTCETCGSKTSKTSLKRGGWWTHRASFYCN